MLLSPVNKPPRSGNSKEIKVHSFYSSIFGVLFCEYENKLIVYVYIFTHVFAYVLVTV